MSKKYGLIHPNAKTKPMSAGSLAAAVVEGPRRLAAFQSDSGDSADDDKTLSKKHMFSTGITQKRQTQLIHSTALNEDPTVFQYDEWFDENDTKRKTIQDTKKTEVKNSKYIDKLLVAADKRKKEFERRIERQVQKERELEGDKFKDKEAFITSSYRQKLEDMKKAEEADQREEYLETIGDVTKQRDLGGFYRHLYEQKLGNNKTVSTIKEKVPTNKLITNHNDNDDDEDEAAIDVDKHTKSDSDSNNNNNSPATKTLIKKTNKSKKNSNVNKQERKYRKRKSSAGGAATTAAADADKSSTDDDDNTNDDPNQMNMKKSHLQSNLDADSDFSIDSSSSEEEEDNKKEDNSNDDTIKSKDSLTKTTTSTEITKDEFKKPFDAISQQIKTNEKQPTDDVKQIDKENLKINDNQSNNNDNDNKNSNDKETIIEEVKRDIWEKRTIGEIFDAALQRYYDRKMLK